MKQILLKILSLMARRIIQKHNPKVIGITGSVGKTSSRQAIAVVLGEHFQVRSSEKNYNNEFGVPFTIIGVDSPGRNPLLWLWVFMKGSVYALFSLNYPEVLVLEMGIDRVGDMDHLLDIVTPDVGVITSIGDSHYEYFNSHDVIEREKGRLAERLADTGVLVLNVDSPVVAKQRLKSRANFVGFGKSEEASVKLLSVKVHFEEDIKSDLVIEYIGETFEVSIFAVGQPHVFAALSGVSVGLSMGLEVADIRRGLLLYVPVPGRQNALVGINDSILLDDTYNASPESVLASLKTLTELPGKRKIAVLGDMLELGEISDLRHKEIGKQVVKMHIDFLVTVGEQAKLIAESAIEQGFTEDNLRVYRDTFSAVYFLQEHIEAGDCVLVKGSQGMRMEKISKELLADQSLAGEVLCRQYGKWVA